MGRRTQEEVNAVFEQAQKLIAKGETITAACRQVKLSPNVYREKIGKPTPSRQKLGIKKRKPVRKLLNVVDLPEMPPKMKGLFMVMGDPASLAEFARSYQ